MFSQLIAPCAMMPSSAACHRQIGRMLARQSRLSLGTVHSAPLRVRHCGARGGVVLAAAGLAEEIQKKNANNSVVVYSKTYCPYCSQVKSLFGKLGVDAKVVELDELADGADIQATLGDITGRSTVPQVFIGGEFVGGCDDTMAAHNSGKLKQLFASAGVVVN